MQVATFLATYTLGIERVAPSRFGCLPKLIWTAGLTILLTAPLMWLLSADLLVS